MLWEKVESPVGPLYLASDGTSITGLWMQSHRRLPQFLPQFFCPSLPIFLETDCWLHAYFEQASLPPLPSLLPQGTDFQKKVFSLLLEVPYGHSTTYGALSRQLQAQGIPSSPQAVGGAVGRNPISILIPCHRVLGTGGSLTGYANGLEKKRHLLQLEGIPFCEM